MGKIVSYLVTEKLKSFDESANHIFFPFSLPLSSLFAPFTCVSNLLFPPSSHVICISPTPMPPLSPPPPPPLLPPALLLYITASSGLPPGMDHSPNCLCPLLHCPSLPDQGSEPARFTSTLYTSTQYAGRAHCIWV